MTRARAVKAAMERLFYPDAGLDDGIVSVGLGDTRTELQRAFDEGRIEGMRLLTKFCKFRLEAEQYEARALARKVRG